MPGIFNLARSLGVKKISVLRFVPQGRGYLIRRYSLNKIQYLELKKMIEAARKNGYNVRTGSPFNFLLLNDKPECSAAIDRIIIGPDLRIYPCDAFKQIKAEDLVGTLEYSAIDRWTLWECWEKSPYLKAIREHLIKSVK